MQFNSENVIRCHIKWMEQHNNELILLVKILLTIICEQSLFIYEQSLKMTLIAYPLLVRVFKGCQQYYHLSSYTCTTPGAAFGEFHCLRVRRSSRSRRRRRCSSSRQNRRVRQPLSVTRLQIVSNDLWRVDNSASSAGFGSGSWPSQSTDRN